MTSGKPIFERAYNGKVLAFCIEPNDWLLCTLTDGGRRVAETHLEGGLPLRDALIDAVAENLIENAAINAAVRANGWGSCVRPNRNGYRPSKRRRKGQC